MLGNISERGLSKSHSLNVKNFPEFTTQKINEINGEIDFLPKPDVLIVSTQ